MVTRTLLAAAALLCIAAPAHADPAAVKIEICSFDPEFLCGVDAMRVGETVTIKITSPIAGRLILTDENASGEQTQIFPNGISAAGEALRLQAGVAVELPAPEHGFRFTVTEPVGPSRLMAMVIAEGAAPPAIVSENARQRGIATVPASRRVELTAREPVALGELAYQVVR